MLVSMLIALAGVDGPVSGRAALYWPAVRQDGKVYVISTDEQRRVIDCEPLDSDVKSEGTAAACRAIVARGVPEGVEPARRSNGDQWVQVEDYPPEAVASRQSGATEVLFEINVDGKIAGCVPYRRSGVVAIDQAIYRAVTRRARFIPARFRGTPVPAAATVLGRMFIP